MFSDENAPLALLIEVTPKLAKKRFRENIYQSWNYKCAYCEADATSLDHIIPRHKSGATNRNNLVPACKRCNSNKGSTEIKNWYLKQDFFTQDRMNKIEAWISQDNLVLFDYSSDSCRLAS